MGALHGLPEAPEPGTAQQVVTTLNQSNCRLIYRMSPSCTRFGKPALPHPCTQLPPQDTLSFLSFTKPFVIPPSEFTGAYTTGTLPVKLSYSGDQLVWTQGQGPSELEAQAFARLLATVVRFFLLVFLYMSSI